jgi:hypothetical protein
MRFPCDLYRNRVVTGDSEFEAYIPYICYDFVHFWSLIHMTIIVMSLLDGGAGSESAGALNDYRRFQRWEPTGKAV